MSANLHGRATAAEDLIPGAYEQRTVTRRQPGSMGGPAFGSAGVPGGPGSMSAATVADREREGGGALSQRRPARHSTWRKLTNQTKDRVNS